MIKKLLKNKFICSALIVLVISVICEVFIFNFSSWKVLRVKPILISGEAQTVDGEYLSDAVTIDGPVKNVNVSLQVLNYDVADVDVIITDEGDKYEYATPKFRVYNDVADTGFANIYTYGDVHTLRVRVTAPEGCNARIDSIYANVKRPVNFKPLRFLVLAMILYMGYLVWTTGGIHDIYYDNAKWWQRILTLIVIILLLAAGKKITTADKLLMDSPWPHHKQYQELAHSLSVGTVELTQHEADPALLEMENPYDTIALMAENVPFSMDYAYYEGHYYEYFGIVPEVLFYYPYYRLKGIDLPNYKAVYGFYIVLVIGVFLTTSGWIKRYVKSIPYLFYLLINISLVLCANFIYLTVRPDVYNVPIIGGVACTFMGLGCWLHGLSCKNRPLSCVLLAAGSLFMALVAGCRPQLLLISGLAIIWFVFSEGFKNRRLFTKASLAETIAFCLPYLPVAVLVCWYNKARFGNIFDFGATYSLTTNDMNHRGFNFDRLFRCLYCYLLQPASFVTDFPYLVPNERFGEYMGRFLCEYTYGGMMVANAFTVSIWLWLVKGVKKAPGAVKASIVYLIASGLVIAAFDANAAGLLYRYTCDFAPAFMLAAAILWMMYLDRGRVLSDYRVVSRIAYVCILLALGYTFVTVFATGSSINLADDNRMLYYSAASYFKW